MKWLFAQLIHTAFIIPSSATRHLCRIICMMVFSSYCRLLDASAVILVPAVTPVEVALSASLTSSLRVFSSHLAVENTSAWDRETTRSLFLLVLLAELPHLDGVFQFLIQSEPRIFLWLCFLPFRVPHIYDRFPDRGIFSGRLAGHISSPVDLGAMGLGTPRSIPLSTPCFITTLSTSIISMVTKPAVSYTT